MLIMQCVSADTAAMKVRAMRDVGTRLALRHVGYTEALVGEKKMRKLLENWDNTWRKILSKREQKARILHLRRAFPHW